MLFIAIAALFGLLVFVVYKVFVASPSSAPKVNAATPAVTSQPAPMMTGATGDPAYMTGMQSTPQNRTANPSIDIRPEQQPTTTMPVQ